MEQEISTTLRTLLAKNIVRFTFRKVDGTIRYAVGTRNLDLARAYLHTKAETRDFVIPTPKGEEQPNSYYDVEKLGWRSYKPCNLISIDGFVAVDYTKGIPVKAVEINNPKPTPKVEMPTPTRGGGETPKTGNDKGNDIIRTLFGGGIGLGGFGGGLPLGGGVGGETPKGKGGAVPTLGTPTDMGGFGVGVPVDGVSVEDFARMVAHYVVEDLVARLQR